MPWVCGQPEEGREHGDALQELLPHLDHHPRFMYVHTCIITVELLLWLVTSTLITRAIPPAKTYSSSVMTQLTYLSVWCLESARACVFIELYC